jgi:hypothetical protein
MARLAMKSPLQAPEMIAATFFGMEFGGIVIENFENTLLTLVSIFASIIATFLSLFIRTFKLVVASLLDCIGLVWSVRIWFGKPRRKPPDKSRVPLSRFPTFSLIVVWFIPPMDLSIGTKQFFHTTILRLQLRRTFRHKLVRESRTNRCLFAFGLRLENLWTNQYSFDPEEPIKFQMLLEENLCQRNAVPAADAQAVIQQQKSSERSVPSAINPSKRRTSHWPAQPSTYRTRIYRSNFRLTCRHGNIKSEAVWRMISLSLCCILQYSSSSVNQDSRCVWIAFYQFLRMENSILRERCNLQFGTKNIMYYLY